MKLNKTLFVACGLLLGLSACASPARMNAMIPERSPATLIAENSPLLKAINLKGVTGGETTNPIWTSEVGNPEFLGALKNSLANHAMLAKSGGRYSLTAQLLSVNQPIFGASFTVTASVRYFISEIASNKTYFVTTVTLPYTARFSDSFLGAERLRLANEGSIRVNIEGFLKQLVAHAKKSSSLHQTITIALADIKFVSSVTEPAR